MASGVWRERIEAAQRLMAEQGVDFLIIAPSSDLVYLLDVAAHASERLAVLVVPRQGRPTVVVGELEQSRFAARADLVDLHTWAETANPVSLVQALVAGTGRPVIAVSEQLWSVFLLRIITALPEATFISAGGLLRELRMVKDTQELAHLREAAHRADLAWDEFAATATLTGKTEVEAARELAALRAKHGLEVEGIGICASGPNSAAPHHITGDRVISEGDVVIFDFGGRVAHYAADITRTVHIGEPGDEYRQVYDIVLRANEAALAALRTGNTCQDADRAARRLITGAGYGEAFIHRVGHGLGLDGHEEPYLVEGNTLPLRAGMVVSDEPGIYLAGRFGVRIEDAVIVTDDGGEKINHARRELTVMS